MKRIVKAMILCAACMSLMMLSGCTDSRTADGTGTTTTRITTADTTDISDTSYTRPETSLITSDTYETDMPGEYEAGEDGVVSEDGENNPDNNGFDKTDENDVPSTVITTSGRVTGEGDINDMNGTKIKDEAAFASSYMSGASADASDNTKICWGLGKERDGTNRPVDAVKAQEKYSALGARFLTDGDRICLTFDEGYENGYTAKILDVLKEKDVKAVFFVTYDYCRSSPQLVQRMIDEGHTVGNHTWTHPSMPEITQKQVWSEVTKLHNYVKDNFGYEMTLFRFPMGEFSARCLDDLKGLGYTSVFWSFAYSDWNTDSQPDPSEALEKLKTSTHSGIYLLHAVSRTNAEILPEIIDYWREQGLSVGSEI